MLKKKERKESLVQVKDKGHQICQAKINSHKYIQN